MKENIEKKLVSEGRDFKIKTQDQKRLANALRLLHAVRGEEMKKLLAKAPLN